MLHSWLTRSDSIYEDMAELPAVTDGDRTKRQTSPRAAENTVKFTTKRVPAGCRQHYRDCDGISREIWMPGDGDGQENSGLPRGEVTKQWRFFQSPLGIDSIPPKYVVLDDAALYQVLHSPKLIKADMAKSWECDFGKSKGMVMTNRPTRGRPAWLPRQRTETMPLDMSERTALVHSVGVGRRQGKTVSLIGEPAGYTAYLFGKEEEPQVRIIPISTASQPASSKGSARAKKTRGGRSKHIWRPTVRPIYPGMKPMTPGTRKRSASQMADDSEDESTDDDESSDDENESEEDEWEDIEE